MELPIDISDLDKGLDRDLLKKLKKRFLAVSDERLARTRLGMNDRQQLVLDTLAALFHYNHPGLPGYISHKTPGQISQFELNNRTKLAIKRLSRSFNFSEPRQAEPDIYAIYIMGSVGTIAHGSASDLDVWVCYRPGLDAAAVRLLTHKGERISIWAQTQGVEVHCFPMDCDAFKSGQTEALDEESSGSSQHYLLLDEFYRTAIWLGGRIPLWWFVPPEREQDYDHCAEILLRKQFIRPKEVLDFGSSAHIPPGEFVGAGIWHLYKGIDTPYKSVLKLLLLEAYASRYPEGQPLSVDFKRKVYAGEMEIDKLDAYICLYQHLQDYLAQRKETKRLELVRRALYFKVHCPLTRKQGSLSWQWRTLKNLVQQWAWDKPQLTRLDGRKQWKAGQVKLEKQNLVHELISSYRFITQFANKQKAHNRIDKQELTTLGHKLRAAFDRKPGKIELINPAISNNMSEAMLMLRHRPDRPANERWSVYALPHRTSPAARNLLLKQASQLNEILCWSLANNVLDPQTELLIEGSHVNNKTLRQYISAVLSCFTFPLDKPKHNAFLAQSKVSHIMVYANLTAPTSTHDLANLPNRDQDAFCFGDSKRNLIYSLDIIYTTSWNEIFCLTFQDQPLQRFVQQYWHLCRSQAKDDLPEIAVHCSRSHISSLITSRLEEFFANLNQAITNTLDRYNSQSLNFIFQTGTRYHLLHTENHNSLLDSFDSRDQLQSAIQTNHWHPTLWSLESRALTNEPVRLALEHTSESGVNVFFYLPAKDMAKCYFMDELRNITVLQFPVDRVTSLLQSLHQFIRRIITQNLTSHFDQDHLFGVYPVNFYHMKRERGVWVKPDAVSVATEIEVMPNFDIQAIAEAGDNSEITYRFICDQHELEGDQSQQLASVARFIRSRRKIAGNYPLYINDLDLSQCQTQLTGNNELTLGDYLRVKNQLEQQLNNPA